MIKNTILLLLVLLSGKSMAQWTLGTGLIYYNGGNVGIGTTTPTGLLDIKTPGAPQLILSTSRVNSASRNWAIGTNSYAEGDIAFLQSTTNTNAPTVRRFIIGAAGNVGINISNPTAKLDLVTSTNGDGIQISYPSSNWVRFVPRLAVSTYNNITAEADAGIIFGGNGGINTSNGFTIAPHRSDYSGLRITSTGNVGIGIGDTHGFRLAVGGKMIAEEVVVQLVANWPDYVFESAYKLPELSDVEKYIILNKHLPGIPSAKDVTANGLEVGEFQAQLLLKVEELTLYVIELKKEIEALKIKKE
jgi:hypothetical protein